MRRPKVLLVNLAVVVISSGFFVANTATSGVAATKSLTSVVQSCPAANANALRIAPALSGLGKTVALTFDDGPGQSTLAILKILKAYHVRATFFNVGFNFHAYPQLIRLEAAEGFLLGDHTNGHPDLSTLSPARQSAEIGQVGALQRQLTGSVPCVFRPPYGIYNATTLAIAKRNHMSLWQWSEGGGDWEAKGSNSSHWIHYIESAVIQGSVGQPHPVVLLHDQRGANPATVSALPRIINFFQRHHYTFVDLLGRTGPPGVCGSPSAPTPPTTFSTLANGTTLASGDAYTSPGGQFTLTMEPNGQLIYTETNGTMLWTSPTGGHLGAVATVSGGALRVNDSDGTLLWSTNTTNADELRLKSNGELTLASGATEVWTSHSTLTTLHSGDVLEPGWYVSSPNGRCRLTMTTSGQLALVTPDHQTFWSTQLATTTRHAVLNPNGAFELVTSDGTVSWTSPTTGHASDALRVLNNATLAITTQHGVTIWATE